MDRRTDRQTAASHTAILDISCLFQENILSLYTACKFEHRQPFVMSQKCTKPYRVVQNVFPWVSKKNQTNKPFLSDVRDIWNIFAYIILCSCSQEICTLKNDLFFFFFWSITVMAVCVWESWTSFSHAEFLFSAGSCWSNSQLHRAISRSSCFVVLSLRWERQGSGFDFNSWCSSPHWMRTALWEEQAGVSCLWWSSDSLDRLFSGCLLSFQSHFKQPFSVWS